MIDFLKINELFAFFANLSWATWVNRSTLLICPEQYVQITHIHSFDMSNLRDERIPNPAVLL